MARAKKQKLSLEELLEQTLVKEDEYPCEVPSNWLYFYFTSLIDIQGGTQPPKSQFIDTMQDGYIRLVQIRDFASDKYKVYVPLKKNLRIFNKEDILIARYGASIGRICTGLEGACNVALAKTTFSEEVLNRRYVYWLLNSQHFQIPLMSISRTAQAGFNKDDLAEFKMPLPPFSEQQRIVARIESLFEKLDTAKEVAQDALESFEKRKAAILHKAFTGELTKKWREENGEQENEIISQVLQYFSDNAPNRNVRQIIESQQNIDVIWEIKNSIWYRCTIGSVAVVVNGSTPSRQKSEYWNGDIPWVSSGEVKNNIITKTKETITESGYNNSSVKLLPRGTVLIAMIGEGKTRGQSAILDIEATTNQNIAAIDISHQQVHPKFMWYWLQKQYENNRTKGNGTGPQALNCQKVRDLEFILPPLKEQEEIVKILDSLILKEQEAQELCDVIEKIEIMKKAILARAFCGELGTNNPEEESAIELLKEVLKEKL